MNKDEILGFLKDIKEDKVSLEEGVNIIKDLPYHELDFAKIDNHREIRVGYPEVIYCQGKTVEQVRKIIEYMLEKDSNILATRATREMYDAVKNICLQAKYDVVSKIIMIEKKEITYTDTYVAVVTAGTSDIDVAEEAAVVLEQFGNKVERIYDVGVAGIHRLFDKIDVIKKAKVVIVIAGMEGALASVVGGLVDKPVIAVPTSVGYGANFGGISALLSMLNSCASGMSVVNIDNGFGAGYLASMINKI
ncbi:MAG: nickel pincer cofactor biosynthesis protein LarB [Clostridiaceae bacterium]